VGRKQCRHAKYEKFSLFFVFFLALSYISYSIASKLIYRISVRAVCFPGPDEQRLLEASMAYAAGNPIMSDAEFDELKLKLKVSSPLLPSIPYII